MSAARLAWSLWVVTLALVAGGLLLGVANTPLYEYWVVSLISPTFATLGALIISRRPGNVIGWIFCVPSVAGGIQMFCGQYATVALSPGGAQLPGGAFAGWLSTLMQSSFVVSILFLVLLFPNGRLLSPRWRVVAWTTGLTVAAGLVSLALRPGPLEGFPSARNPFGIEGASFLEWLDAAGGVLSLACIVAALVSLILRFWRSSGEERLQLKWFVYAATLGFVAILLGGERQIIGTLVWTLAPLGLPVSAGIAILRYRLYDIDRLINRTLVYGSLTAALVTVYVGSVVLLQGLFRALTGEEQQSQLVIVASTLAIAALFNPFRRRIQGFIDRRFYRKKYDAARTLEAFSAKLRDELDLEQLKPELLAVVREALQPAHVSLWLRPARGFEKGEE
jgi:hypothetical protein